MSDLDSGEAFEPHAERMILKLISQRKLIPPITGKETAIHKRAGDILRLNEEISEGIPALVFNTRSYVFASDLVLFLLASWDYGILEDAKDILLTMRQDERSMSLSDLMSALEDTKGGVPGGWAASLYGELGAEKNAKPMQKAPRVPTVNLSDMMKRMQS